MSRGRTLPASLAIGLTAIIGVIIVTTIVFSTVLSPSGSDDASTERTTSTLPIRERVEPAEFLDVWERSHVGPYALTGSITRSRGDAIEVTPFRRASRDGRELNQVGSTAIVIGDGQQLVCEVLDRDDIRCGGAEPAPTLVEQRATLAAEFAPEGRYLIFADLEPGCYLLVFDGAVGLGSRFGQETRMCFDPATGAMVSETQRTGASVETTDTVSLSSEVDDADLEPVFLG